MSESDELEKRIEWLDEQRREEAEARARLEERLLAITERLEVHTHQVQALSDEVTRLGTLAARIQQVDDSLAKHRKEVSRQLEEAERRRSAKEDRIESMRKKDQQALRKTIDAIKDQLSRLERLEQAIQARQKEEMRLQHELNDVGHAQEALISEVEAQKRSMAAFEEARGRAEKKADEALALLRAMRKKTEALDAKLEQADDEMRRQSIHLAEMRAGEEERARLLETWLEDQKMWTSEFEKTWTEWEKLFARIEETAKSTEERLGAYEQTYLAVKRVQGELEALMERLERRITEVSEVQRLAEERVRKEWTSFQAEEVKRWNTFQIGNEEQWREHERRHDRMDETLADLVARLASVEQALETQAEQQERRTNEMLALLRGWALDQEQEG